LLFSAHGHQGGNLLFLRHCERSEAIQLACFCHSGHDPESPSRIFIYIIVDIAPYRMVRSDRNFWDCRNFFGSDMPARTSSAVASLALRSFRLLFSLVFLFYISINLYCPHNIDCLLHENADSSRLKIWDSSLILTTETTTFKFYGNKTNAHVPIGAWVVLCLS
jgi:hypothetical protein